MPGTTNTYSVLWNDDYLKSFASKLKLPECSCVFWEVDGNGELIDFKKKNIRKIVTKFFPALGVHKLVLGNDGNHVPTQRLVFIRDNRCHEITTDVLRVITNKVFSYLGDIGDEIKAQFHGSTNPFSDDSISIIPDLYDMKSLTDTRDSAFRFFKNGWIEITKDAVSDIHSYDELKDDEFIWNSSVIPRDYEVLNNEDVPTHFKDFVANLARDEEGVVDENALERLELAIGYLCHRHHKPAERKYVLLVDKFSDGLANKSNGGSGKSLLVSALGKLMNLVELDGRTFGKGNRDSVDGKAFAPVTAASEIVHIDDAVKSFPSEILFTRVTGNFHIRRNYQDSFSIPADKAPKIVVTSNFPMEGDGHSYKRREFIVEVSNFYRLRSEYCHQTPFHIHGNKNIAADGVEGWDALDWSEFYKYVFSCISKYISKGLPASGGESAAYKRAKLVDTIGSVEVLDYLLQRLDEYCEHGEDVFMEEFYRDVMTAFPIEFPHLKPNLFHYLVAAGNLAGKHPNQFKGSTPQQQRLTPQRYQKWCDAGLKDWKDKNGNVKQLDDRVYTFAVTSLANKATLFSNSKPNFNIKKKMTPTPPPHQEEELDGVIAELFKDV